MEDVKDLTIESWQQALDADMASQSRANDSDQVVNKDGENQEGGPPPAGQGTSQTQSLDQQPEDKQEYSPSLPIVPPQQKQEHTESKRESVSFDEYAKLLEKTGMQRGALMALQAMMQQQKKQPPQGPEDPVREYFADFKVPEANGSNDEEHGVNVLRHALAHSSRKVEAKFKAENEALRKKVENLTQMLDPVTNHYRAQQQQQAEKEFTNLLEERLGNAGFSSEHERIGDAKDWVLSHASQWYTSGAAKDWDKRRWSTELDKLAKRAGEFWPASSSGTTADRPPVRRSGSSGATPKKVGGKKAQFDSAEDWQSSLRADIDRMFGGG